MTGPLFSLSLDIRGRCVVVVGGGAVGQRKARKLLQSGAQVRLICLEPCPSSLAQPTLTWLTEPYHADHLTDAQLVFAAATPSVNRQVIQDAHARNLWVNVATAPQLGDLLLPAVLECGDLTVAVSTHGQAPGLAQAVRDLLRGYFDDAFAHWLKAVAEVRAYVLAHLADETQRHSLLANLCQTHWLTRFRQEEPSQVQAEMWQFVRSRCGAGL